MTTVVKFMKRQHQAKPAGTLKFLLHEHLGDFDLHRGVERIHASELTRPNGFCPREFAISHLIKKKLKGSSISTSSQVTFRIGRDMQDAIVHWFADMDRAIGHWICYGCGEVYEFCKRPKNCSECSSPNFKAEEARFESQKNGASAGVDMFAQVMKEKLTPVEIKTIDKEEFKKLEAPLAEHLLRTKLYLRIIAESNSPWKSQIDLSEARILYTTKGGFGCVDDEVKTWGFHESFSPFKEYVVKREDKFADGVALRSKVYNDYRKGLIPMPEGICPTSLVERATECSRKKECFSGNYPPQHPWLTK